MPIGSDTVTKINGIDDKINDINDKILSIVFDSKDNVYFGTDNNIYVFKSNETKAKKFLNFNKYAKLTYKYIAIDKNDDIFFGTNSDIFYKKIC
ncbi:hypothetical protein [Spiroplasma endosymbiont of Polydrusus cervinus]|uniref:hypothetical protein n=1 Tax=Spiroplasma endosymbiont of Polydrusus cervinus TaxID=3066287 RepID=UPI0030D2383B